MKIPQPERRNEMKRSLLSTVLCAWTVSMMMPAAAFAADRGTREVKAGSTITLVSKGSWPYTWTAEDNSIVELELKGTKGSYSYGHECAVTGLRAGTTTVRVDYEELVYDPNARADWFGDWGESVARKNQDTWTVTVTASGGTSVSSGTTGGSSNKTSSASKRGSSSKSAAAGADSGSWKQDGTGWWYEYPDGSYPCNSWQLIAGSWYCFDGYGYIRTGWIWSGKAWYYCDPSNTSSQGKMLASTWTPDGYWVGADGAWIP